jgi:hypothetical protein
VEGAYAGNVWQKILQCRQALRTEPDGIDEMNDIWLELHYNMISIMRIKET